VSAIYLKKVIDTIPKAQRAREHNYILPVAFSQVLYNDVTVLIGIFWPNLVE
jgi:hypothetical protein